MRCAKTCLLAAKTHKIRAKNTKFFCPLHDISVSGSPIIQDGKLVLPLHLYCRCVIVPMQAVASGYATMEGTAGADYWLKNYGQLPSNYITKDEAKTYGWISQKGNLSTVAPGKAIGGDRYFNGDGHLPSAPGRIWYEADINFSSGFRTPERIVYSSDGLIFVTYDHYESFVEVV